MRLKSSSYFNGRSSYYHLVALSGMRGSRTRQEEGIHKGNGTEPVTQKVHVKLLYYTQYFILRKFRSEMNSYYYSVVHVVTVLL